MRSLRSILKPGFEEFLERCLEEKKTAEEFQQFEEREQIDADSEEFDQSAQLIDNDFDREAYEIFTEDQEVEKKGEAAADQHGIERGTEMKGESEEPPQLSPEERRLAEVEQQSVQLLRDTSKNVAKLLDEAADQAFAIRSQAREEGFQAGREEGLIAGIQDGSKQHRQELRNQYESLFRLLNEAAAEVDRERLAFSQQYLEDLRDLAITIAEKVISISLRSSGEVIEKMIQSAVESRRSKPQWVNISISEVDYKCLLENGIDPESIAEDSAERVRLTIVEKAEPGTCLIEFPEEIIDASVSTQMANIKKIAKNEWN